MKDMIDLGRVVSAPTLDELAKKLNTPVENLKKSIADYNAVVEGKTKDAFDSRQTTRLDKGS